eukprot:scaffold12.g8083.t1
MSGLWLHWADGLDCLETAPLALDQLVTPEDALALEGVRVLALRREQSVGRQCLRLAEHATLANHVAWTEKYLALLDAFIAHYWAPRAAQLAGANRSGFRWSSPLSSLPPSSHFALNSVLAERVMAHVFYAGEGQARSLLQEQAYELGSRLLQPAPRGSPSPGGSGGHRHGAASPDRGSPVKRRWTYTTAGDSGGGAGGSRPSSPSKEESASGTGSSAGGTGAEGAAESAYASIAALYRRAAGVLQHIDAELLPAAVAEGLPADRPVEMWQGAAAAMAAVALAQAQAVAAQRAEAKGASPPVLAALHAGAADLFEQASAKLRAIKQASPELKRSLSDRLRRFLAISGRPLSTTPAKAYRALAAELRGQHELGTAVSALRQAITALRQALVVCEKDAEWRAALEPEVAVLEELHASCDRERQSVAGTPSLPVSRVIIQPIKFETPAETEAAQQYF